MSVLNSGKVSFRPAYKGHETDLLLAALAATDYGVLLTDMERTTQACNGRFGEIWGLDPAQVVVSDPSEVRAMVRHRIPNYEEWMAGLDASYADADKTYIETLRLIKPHCMVRRTITPFRNDKGENVGRLWTFLDITNEENRKQRSHLLQEASLLSHPDPKFVYKRLVEALASLYDSIALLSIRHDNYMEFRAVGGPKDHFVHDMPGNQLADSFCQFCLSTGPIVIQNAVLEESMADILPVQLGFTRYAGTPILNPDSEVLGTLCFMDGRSDEILDEEDLSLLRLIAMRISSELEREKYILNLENDLANAKAHAHQNEKLAVAGTLSASIAHDIRNILTALNLDIEMAGSDPADCLRLVSGHMDRFSLLAHRLLSYAKPQKVHQTSVSVSESLERVLSLMSGHIQVGQINLETDLPSDLPLVMADPVRLDHLFVNLMLNALQSMGLKGTLRIEARSERNVLIVAIQDTGPGMSAVEQEALFRPFASQRADGFGLGLFSAQQIAGESMGRISLDSQPGIGTKFLVEIPHL